MSCRSVTFFSDGSVLTRNGHTIVIKRLNTYTHILGKCISIH